MSHLRFPKIEGGWLMRAVVRAVLSVESDSTCVNLCQLLDVYSRIRVENGSAMDLYSAARAVP